MKRAVLLGLLATAACGDPIADGDYLGEPLFQLQGRIVGDAGTSVIRRPYLGLLWVNPLGVDGSFEFVSSIVPITQPRFPGEFSINLFDAPPDRVHFPIGSADIALGMAVVLDDVNGDGRFELDPFAGIVPPDVVFGGSRQLIAHVRNLGSAECQAWAFGVSEPIESGFHLMRSAECDDPAMMPLLSRDTPLEVELFPPTQAPFDVSDEEPEPCPEPPSCDEDPAQYWCKQDAMLQACYEEKCGSPELDYQQCIEERCLGAADFGACIEEHCDPIFAAVFACYEAECSLGAICGQQR